MSILASHNNKRSSTEIHGGSRGPGPLSTDDADNPPSVVFTGLNNIHEDYVDWDHMKRQAMLTSLLTSHKKLIDESRVRLEEAAIEKKRKSEDLARLLRYAVEKLQESKQSLESVRIEEKEYRDRVESHMETLHSLKEQMIRKGNEHNMNKTETEIATAMSRNSWPTSSSIISKGMNTITVVSDETEIAPHTCLAPSKAARDGSFPFSRIRYMFSRTTIAASTTIPTAKAIPASETTLIERPNNAIATNDEITETGIANPTTNVARTDLRNKSNITTAMVPPTQIF